MSALLRIQDPAPPAQTLEERVRAAVPAKFDVEVFIPPAGDLSFSRTCRLRGCTRHSSVFGMCPSHRALLERFLGRRTQISVDEVMQFVQANGGTRRVEAGNHYDFRGLPALLADELRLGLHLSDQEQGSLSARAFRVVRNRLLEMGVQSVFETLVPSAAEVSSKPNMFIALDWYSATPRADHMERAFLRRVINAAAQVHHPMAFEERDKWRSQDLGIFIATRGRVVHFEGFQLPWMKAWVKRKAWYDLRVGAVKFQSLVAQVGSIKRLDAYLASLERPPRGIDGLTREHLEGFMLHLRQSPTVDTSRSLTSVRTLLQTHRDLEWEPRLGKGVVIRSGEGRFSRPPVPRPVHPHVLNQLMAPEFLERIEPWLKTALLLGRHQGLRPSSVVTLPFDCLSFAGDEPGRAVLTYHNVKLNRQAMQPIEHQAVIEAIQAQQTVVRERFPDGSPWLFPGFRRNGDGRKPAHVSSLDCTLKHYLTLYPITDSEGRVLRSIPWTGFRDKVATDLLNSGVSPAIVARWLDHRGMGSLEHYATVHVETMRRALKESKLINISGQEVGLLVEEGASAQRISSLRELEDLRLMVKRAVNTVVGGLCTLPTQTRCVHHNRCFTCQHFATTPQELPVLLQEAQRAGELAQDHRRAGRLRFEAGQRETQLEIQAVITRVRPWLEMDPEMQEWARHHGDELDRIEADLKQHRSVVVEAQDD